MTKFIKTGETEDSYVFMILDESSKKRTWCKVLKSAYDSGTYELMVAKWDSDGKCTLSSISVTNANAESVIESILKLPDIVCCYE